MNDRLAIARKALEQAEQKAGLSVVRAVVPSNVERARRGVPVNGEVALDAYEVPDLVAPVLPNGLIRGRSVEVGGSRSLALLLAGIASRQGAWVAILGMEDIGWAVAEDSGIDPARLAHVPQVKQQGSQVVSAAIDGFDVVVIGRVVLDRRERRVLDKRAQTKGSILLAERWEGAGERLTCSLEKIGGIDGARGHIKTLDYAVASPWGRVTLSFGREGWRLPAEVGVGADVGLGSGGLAAGSGLGLVPDDVRPGPVKIESARMRLEAVS